LDYRPALAYYGLQFKPVEPPTNEHDEEPDETAGWLGADLTSALVVRQVKRGTPAHQAGLNVGDELIAIEGHRVRDLDRLLASYRPGDTVELTLARRDQLTRLRVELGRKPDDRWKLQVIPGDPMRERGRREDWLGPDR
ncbi:MAG TPA: PDZ domain-containing protein, partial [Kofleriaceae bacterium]|nr:PDZ domain-containing protein [Kofleriaceae bacterium]